MKKQLPYRWLAQYYDRILAPWGKRWFDMTREHILGPILLQVESGCDMACGTGTTALNLAARGIGMFALDLSPMMCRLTKLKARRAGLPLRVLRADMRDFRLPKPVELILCEADAVNHISRKTDLARVAKAAARALRPGGYFYFDVNNRRAFEKYWNGNIWVEDTGVILVMRNGSDPKRDRAWSDIEWFIQDGKHWQRHQEHVEEICWTPAEIRQALHGAGFDKIRAWDAAPLFKGDKFTTPGCRTFYLARKSPS